LEFGTSAYDMVYDCGCFHHIYPHRRRGYVDVVQHALKPSGLFGLVCFAPDGGADMSDWEVYRKRSMGGGLGYTEERLRGIFSDAFEILEFRRMKQMGLGSGRFGEAFCWVMLAQSRPADSGLDEAMGCGVL